MFSIKLCLVLVIFHVSDCVRRIKDGKPLTTPKSYVVYLVKAPISSKQYDSWLCGGALVSSSFIITSAACVDDVEFLYAIAGYEKYVPDALIETDECTKQKKKKVVYTCTPKSHVWGHGLEPPFSEFATTEGMLLALQCIGLVYRNAHGWLSSHHAQKNHLSAAALAKQWQQRPKAYELKYDQLEKWSLIDIALVKVESPYDFNDESYKTICSYIPSTILVNYEPKYQAVDTDAMVLGWGHKESWRKPSDTENYNQQNLHYASTLIMDKTLCKNAYAAFANMADVIDRFMICTLEDGNLNEKGDIIVASPHTANGCENKQALTGIVDESCSEEEDGKIPTVSLGDTRKEGTKSNQTDAMMDSIDSNRSTHSNRTIEYSRKSGICQNDHGGPLVTWVGSHEVLIGVASVFIVSKESKCVGPYLYTSTQCNGAFLDCILDNSELPDKQNRRAICDSPPIQRGYDTIEKHISWRNHPAGPAENEMALPNITFVQDEKHISNNINRTSNIKKFSENETILVRPQRPLYN